jgi:hypothetical protein
MPLAVAIFIFQLAGLTFYFSIFVEMPCFPHMIIVPKFLGAKSTSIRDCVGWSVSRLVGPLVRPSVPTMQLRGKLVTSQFLREEEEEEENWLRRDSFAPRD